MRAAAAALALVACPERRPSDEANAVLAAVEARSPFEGENIVIPRGALVSFGRNPTHHEKSYQWTVREVVGEDGGRSVHAFCSGRFVVRSVLGEDYALDCEDTDAELPQ